MPSFSAPPIRIGQPWSCLLRLAAPSGAPAPNLTGASLIVQFRTSAEAATVLAEIRTGAGIDIVSADTVRLTLTAQQTAKLQKPVTEFALGRIDGGLREISPGIIWPVVFANNRGVA